MAKSHNNKYQNCDSSCSAHCQCQGVNVITVVVPWLIVIIYCPPRGSDSVWSMG